MRGNQGGTTDGQVERSGHTGPSNDELDTLLLEYEQSRVDIRRNLTRQGQIITSGIAALGVISGYTVMSADSGYFSSPLVVAIPFVVGLMAILSMEGANNATLLRRHTAEVEDRIREIVESADFGYESRLHSYFEHKTVAIDAGSRDVNWYNVPFMFIWSITLLYLIAHVAIISLSPLYVVPIEPVLESSWSMLLVVVGYAFVVAIVAVAAYAQLRVRTFRNQIA